MSIFRKIVLSALVVGLLSGILLTIIQSFQVNPIIVEAESFEVGVEQAKLSMMDKGASSGSSSTNDNRDTHNHAASDNGNPVHQHQHGHDSWQPRTDLERAFYTYVSNVLAAIGFSLLLISFMALRNDSLNLLKGGAWGLAGFVTFFLAPSIGLPPEIPGTLSATLVDKQIWWLLAATATGSGLGILVFASGAYKALGLVLVLLPQVIGAPVPLVAGFENNDPEAVATLEKLSQRFYPATTMVNALYWLFMGAISSIMVKRYIYR